MRFKDPYSLCSRRSKDGKKTWYYYVYDETGKRRRFSTGKSTKAAATAFVKDLLIKGALIPKEPVSGLLTFGDYAKDWWTDQCEYIIQERARGKEYTPRYLSSQRHQMELHILPFFGKQPLQSIDDKMIEKWRVWVRKPKSEKGHGLKAKSANNLLSNLSVMLDFARRQHLIQTNPRDNVKQLIDEAQDERNIMDQPQVDIIFSSLAYY